MMIILGPVNEKQEKKLEYTIDIPNEYTIYETISIKYEKEDRAYNTFKETVYFAAQLHEHAFDKKINLDREGQKKEHNAYFWMTKDDIQSDSECPRCNKKLRDELNKFENDMKTHILHI